LNLGLRPDISVQQLQLKVSLSESLSKRLSQKLKWPNGKVSQLLSLSSGLWRVTAVQIWGRKFKCQVRWERKCNKKAQLSLTDPRDAKACQKLLQFDVLTTLSLTILAYIFMRLAAVASEICKIPRNSLKIQTYEVQDHPRSSILVPIESPYVTSY